MKLMILLTADYATVDVATGKLHILGAFSNITCKGFPAVHPRMALVAKIRAEFGEHSEQRILRIDLVDEDKNQLYRLKGPFQLPPARGGMPREFNAIWELNDIKFPHEGGYEFEIYVDDEPLGLTPIELTLIKQQSE